MNKDTKIIKLICEIIGIISIILVIGSVGGLEQNTLTILGFFKWQLGAWLAFILSIVGWYKMQAIEDGRFKRGIRKAV